MVLVAGSKDVLHNFEAAWGVGLKPGSGLRAQCARLLHAHSIRDSPGRMWQHASASSRNSRRRVCKDVYTDGLKSP